MSTGIERGKQTTYVTCYGKKVAVIASGCEGGKKGLDQGKRKTDSCFY